MIYPPTELLNFRTGHSGLIAVDKVGNKVHFLDLVSYRIVTTLDDFTPRVHELAISPDRNIAFVPIYGDGKHGDNPHPGHQLAVIDLLTRTHTGYLNVAPYQAPHGLRWGPQGELYCLCENSGVVLMIDPKSGKILEAIPTGSTNAHRMEILPDGSKLYTENEEDASVSVIDLQTRKPVHTLRLPGALNGLGLSPDGHTLVLVDATRPRLYVLDTRNDRIARELELQGYSQPGQIARYSPDGKYLVVTSHDEPIATVFSADFESQRHVELDNGPMDMAFHDDGCTVLIANHDAGTLSVVDLASGQTLRTFQCGTCIETLAFF